MVEESIKSSESKIIDENKSGYEKQSIQPDVIEDDRQPSPQKQEITEQQTPPENGDTDSNLGDDDDMKIILNVDDVTVTTTKTTPTITTSTKLNLSKLNTGKKTATTITTVATIPNYNHHNDIEPEINKNSEKLIKSGE